MYSAQTNFNHCITEPLLAFIGSDRNEREQVNEREQENEREQKLPLFEYSTKMILQCTLYTIPGASLTSVGVSLTLKVIYKFQINQSDPPMEVASTT